MSKLWYDAVHRPAGRGTSQATHQVIVDADGKAKTVPVVGSITKLGTITTRKAVAPPKEAAVKAEKPDELTLVVEYYNQQMAQVQGPKDERSYRERIKDKMIARAQSTSEPTPALAKSLVGRTWMVGDLRATIVSDDGHVCRYKFGQFGETKCICRIKAEANVNRRTLPVVHENAVTSGRMYSSKAPSGKQRISEV